MESRGRVAGRGSHCSNSLEEGAGRLCAEKSRERDQSRGGRGPAGSENRWVAAKRGGERRGRCTQRAGSRGARGECDISGDRRLRLEEAARLGCAVHTSPRGGRRPGQAAGMSTKERPKGKVIKDSVTLLPCFYFVEVSWPSALA